MTDIELIAIYQAIMLFAFIVAGILAYFEKDDGGIF
jgi:hypothetical protein